MDFKIGAHSAIFSGINSNLEIAWVAGKLRKMAAVDQVTRRISMSLLAGLSITLVLTFLSGLAIRLFPYGDLPMMPKPFFLYALLPGIAAAECFGGGWRSDAAFLLTNSLAYACAVFCIAEILRKR